MFVCIIVFYFNNIFPPDMHFITNGYKRFSKTNSTDSWQRVPLNTTMEVEIPISTSILQVYNYLHYLHGEMLVEYHSNTALHWFNVGHSLQWNRQWSTDLHTYNAFDFCLQSSGKSTEYTVLTHIGLSVKPKLIIYIPDANFHLLNTMQNCQKKNRKSIKPYLTVGCLTPCNAKYVHTLDHLIIQYWL